MIFIIQALNSMFFFIDYSVECMYFFCFQNVSFPFRPFSSKAKQEKNERKKEILIIFHLEKQIGLERNDISYGVKYTCCHLTSYVKQTQLKLSRIFFPCRGGQDSSICETISALFFAKGRSGILLNENAYSNVIHFIV